MSRKEPVRLRIKVESDLVDHHAHQRQSSPLIYGCIHSERDKKTLMSGT